MPADEVASDLIGPFHPPLRNSREGMDSDSAREKQSKVSGKRRLSCSGLRLLVMKELQKLLAEILKSLLVRCRVHILMRGLYRLHLFNLVS